jgi:ankyrin repeat protein
MVIDTSEHKRSLSTTILSQKKRKRVDVADHCKPTEYATVSFESKGFSTDQVIKSCQARLATPSPLKVEAFTMEVSTAVRENDLEKLKDLHSAGARLDACNRFGDSLLHIACRRGHQTIVEYLLEADAPAYAVDDLNRVPLHDACWTSQPNFGIVKSILKAAPESILFADSRGHTPFDYARRNHWNLWLSFLSENESLIYLGKPVE